jgi:formylmethanofuran dehydrogenase subunit E
MSGRITRREDGERECRADRSLQMAGLAPRPHQSVMCLQMPVIGGNGGEKRPGRLVGGTGFEQRESALDQRIGIGGVAIRHGTSRIRGSPAAKAIAAVRVQMAMIGTEVDVATGVSNPNLRALLEKSASRHRHLCPRQVLGVRAGLYAGRLLPAEFPQTGKRILAMVETDGCFADGVSVATGCSMGHRTMRLADYGKVAVTFIDTGSGRALRFSPLPDLRPRALASVPAAASRWHAYLDVYQQMAAEELFAVREVALNLDLAALIGKPGVRALCHQCGEEILNQRELVREGILLCRSCAGESYWRPKD